MFISFIGNTQLGNDAHDHGVAFSQRVAPYPENAPTLGAEDPIREAVSGDVSVDFALPVASIYLWHATMPSTTVPEAAIDEYGQPGVSEGEIWMARKFLMSSPTGDSSGAQDGG
jgi:hypothetical protein